MDYLDRKYRGRRKENLLNIVYLITWAVTAVAAGLLIFGFLKRDIIDREILYLVVFLSAFIMSVTLAVKSKQHFNYGRIVWLAIQSIILFVLFLISLLVLVR